MINKNKVTVALPPRDYQPKKSEMNKEIQTDVPGKNILAKMDNFAKAVTRSVNIRYRKR